MNPVAAPADASLTTLFDARRLWRGRARPTQADGIPTGLAALDDALPQGGWPPTSLSEILLPMDGVGELQLVLPALATLASRDRPVMLVTPPYLPGVAGWSARGLDMRHVVIVQAASSIETLWAMEQSLRSAACSAVLGWPPQADDRALRRLQVAADTGQTPAFVFRDRRHVEHASPAALRIELETRPAPQLRVRKCRGAQPPAHPVPLPRRGA
jgi:hypothetical protein